jgi:hypothetical protein
MDWDTFIHTARALGLDTDDPHMRELYPWVEQVLGATEALNELDVKGVAPALAFETGQED